MRAMVFTGTGVVEMQDVEPPTPGDGETLVRVTSAGICGSELHGIQHPGFRTPPLVMGHEFAGVTVDGRRVTVNPVVSCGACDLCVADRGQLCRDRGIVGIHRAGAFADEVVVPDALLHELPDEVSDDEGAMVEPLANGVHAWNVAGRPHGARVGVIGAGTIGLVCAMVAGRDAGEVTVVDLAEDRLAVADRLGLGRVAPSLDGEFDVVIDAVGAEATHRLSLEHLRPGGTAVWIGLLSEDAGFDAKDLIRGEKTVRGTFAYNDAEFAEALAMVPDVDLSWSTTFPLSEGADIFTQLMRGRTDVLKALLHPGD